MYDKPYVNRVKYSWDVTMASATQELAIRGPKGKRGVIWDYGIEGVTVALSTFVNGGAGTIAIGSTADADAYGEEFTIGGTAAEDAASVRQTYNLTSPSTTATDFRDFVISTIPKDTKALVTVVESSDGAGTVFAIVDWMD